MGPRGGGASQDVPEPGQVTVAAAERRGHPPPAGSGPHDEDHPPLPPEAEAAAPRGAGLGAEPAGGILSSSESCSPCWGVRRPPRLQHPVKHTLFLLRAVDIAFRTVPAVHRGTETGLPYTCHSASAVIVTGHARVLQNCPAQTPEPRQKRWFLQNGDTDANHPIIAVLC